MPSFAVPHLPPTCRDFQHQDRAPLAKFYQFLWENTHGGNCHPSIMEMLFLGKLQYRVSNVAPSKHHRKKAAVERVLKHYCQDMDMCSTHPTSRVGRKPAAGAHRCHETSLACNINHTSNGVNFSYYEFETCYTPSSWNAGCWAANHRSNHDCWCHYEKSCLVEMCGRLAA